MTTTLWAFAALTASSSPAVTWKGAAVWAVPSSTVTEVMVKPAGVAGTSTTAAEVPLAEPVLVTVTVYSTVALAWSFASVIGPCPVVLATANCGVPSTGTQASLLASAVTLVAGSPSLSPVIVTVLVRPSVGLPTALGSLALVPLASVQVPSASQPVAG